MIKCCRQPFKFFTHGSILTPGALLDSIHGSSKTFFHVLKFRTNILKPRVLYAACGVNSTLQTLVVLLHYTKDIGGFLMHSIHSQMVVIECT